MQPYGPRPSSPSLAAADWARRRLPQPSSATLPCTVHGPQPSVSPLTAQVPPLPPFTSRGQRLHTQTVRQSLSRPVMTSFALSVHSKTTCGLIGMLPTIPPSLGTDHSRVHGPTWENPPSWLLWDPSGTTTPARPGSLATASA